MKTNTIQKKEVSLKTEIRDISPKEAVEMLKLNTANRKINENHVDFLVKEMFTGNWMFDGQPIRLNDKGRVLDGQHRLNAVIKYGKPIKFLIIKGVDTEAFKVMDSGRSRTSGDVLGIKGYKNANVLSAAAKLILAHEYGSQTDRIRKGFKQASNTDILKFIEDNPRLDEGSNQGLTLYRKFNKALTSSQVLGLKFITDKINIEDSDTFWTNLCMGINLLDKDPIRLLREIIMADKISIKKMPYSHKKHLIFKVWNLFRRKKPVSNLYVRKTETLPELI